MKFLVDLPLGGLAKWLRFCGFDADCRRLGPELTGRRRALLSSPGKSCLKRLARPDLVFVTASETEANSRRYSASSRSPLIRSSL